MSAAYIQMGLTLLLSWKQTNLKLDQTAKSSLIKFHIVCNIGYQNTQADERAGDNFRKWRGKVVNNKSKEEGKDQEWIQSSTTPDP